MNLLAFNKAKFPYAAGRKRMQQNAPAAAGGAALPSPMDVHAIVRRKEHLKRYARETQHSCDQLAARLMLPSKRIEELLSGRTPITNELATHIEEMLQLPASWLDDGGSLARGAPQMIDANDRPMTVTLDVEAPSPTDRKQILEHRRLNLTMLTAERGAKNRLAQLAGTSGSRISLMTTARKPVSASFSVAIEDALGLPRGWLDEPRSADAVPAPVWQALSPEAGGEKDAQAPGTAPAARRVTPSTRAEAPPAPTAHAAPPAAAAHPGPAISTATPAFRSAASADLVSTTGLFNKPTGQCGPIAEALAKTIINLSATDQLSEARAFQLLGQVIAACNPAD